jgi:hypothetical protein
MSRLDLSQREKWYLYGLVRQDNAWVNTLATFSGSLTAIMIKYFMILV